MSILKKIKLFIPPFALLIFFLLVEAAGAQYVPLAPLPGLEDTGDTNLENYLGVLFKIGIGLAGVFSVLMLIIAGMQYISGASSHSARSDAHEKITNAIFGLLLALGSWLILNAINPAILNNNLNIAPISPTTKESSINNNTSKQGTIYCYSKTSGTGRSKRTREVCESSCPPGETCTTK